MSPRIRTVPGPSALMVLVLSLVGKFANSIDSWYVPGMIVMASPGLKDSFALASVLKGWSWVRPECASLPDMETKYSAPRVVRAPRESAISMDFMVVPKL